MYHTLCPPSVQTMSVKLSTTCLMLKNQQIPIYRHGNEYLLFSFAYVYGSSAKYICKFFVGRTDREQIRSRINNNDCRTFRPRRPLSTAYRTVLYAVDKGLRGRNVLQSLLLILLRICSRSVRPISTK